MIFIQDLDSRSYLRIASACAGILVLSSALAEIAQNTKAAEDAKYQCNMSGNREVTIARARAYGLILHDRNKLACASDLLFAASEQGAPKLALLTEALGSAVIYIEQVSLERDVDPVGIQTLEWNIRLAKASKLVDDLGQAADAKYPGDPAITTLRAKAELLLHRADEPKDWVAVAKRNMAILEKIVGSNPGVLDGTPLVVLGKLYLDLPPLFGGSPARAVELLD